MSIQCGGETLQEFVMGPPTISRTHGVVLLSRSAIAEAEAMQPARCRHPRPTIEAPDSAVMASKYSTFSKAPKELAPKADRGVCPIKTVAQVGRLFPASLSTRAAKVWGLASWICLQTAGSVAQRSAEKPPECPLARGCPAAFAPPDRSTGTDATPCPWDRGGFDATMQLSSFFHSSSRVAGLGWLESPKSLIWLEVSWSRTKSRAVAHNSHGRR